MTRKRTRQTDTIYLLHFEGPDGDIAHYAGVTSFARLETRLKEHLRGAGTKHTADLIARGYKFIARTRINFLDRRLEHIAGLPHIAKRLCTLCNSEQDSLDISVDDHRQV